MTWLALACSGIGLSVVDRELKGGVPIGDAAPDEILAALRAHRTTLLALVSPSALRRGLGIPASVPISSVLATVLLWVDFERAAFSGTDCQAHAARARTLEATDCPAYVAKVLAIETVIRARASASPGAVAA